MQSAHYLPNLKAVEDLDNMVLASLIAGLGINSADEAVSIKAGATFMVATDAGVLRGCMYRSEPNRLRKGCHSPAWVHFRFEDVEFAKRNTMLTIGDRLNTYSGKWNWMFGGQAEGNRRMAESLFHSLRSLNPRFAVTE